MQLDVAHVPVQKAAARIGDDVKRIDSSAIVSLFALVTSALLVLHFGSFIDRATPALVDDHDIINPLKASASAPLADVWADLKQTDEYQELAITGRASRFRPAHYPLKSLQIYLFGDNIRLWYIAIFAMYVATATALFALLFHSLGLTSAVVFGVLYFAHPAWSDIFPRLGPVEIDCIFVGTILIWLLWRAIVDAKRLDMVLAFPAALVFGATKEPNSVLLIALGALVMVCGLILSNRRMALGGGVATVAGALVLAVFLKLTSTVGSGIVSLSGPTDSYFFHSVRNEAREWMLLTRDDNTGWVVFALLAALACAAIAKASGLIRIAWLELMALLLAVVSIEAMRFTLFYLTYAVSNGGGLDPISMRYGSPMFVVTSIVAAIVFGRLIVNATPKVSIAVNALAMACVLAMLVVNEGVLTPRTLTSREQWRTFNAEAETAILDTANWLTKAREQGISPILLVTGPSLEWEPKLSLMMFLRHRMPDTPVYFDPKEQSINHKFYVPFSARYGGQPLPETVVLTPENCIEVHVDVERFKDSRCTTLSIVKPN
ncbi:hypothetical protein IVA80_22565 [Bradyrhizobium sp. 139]|uniref:hypothetical protein n=1 Tax=Bradyrhizobium sp. 139 TaxID=2782616 RepID=UPI001FF73C24|nr:hypothetical protein [Bradyrhizobium sp. 139]MCK1743552.1 hypothetical protein [Bradyrhizobium sp. 139]